MTDVTALAAIPSALQSATSTIHKSVHKLEQNAHTIATSQSVMSKDVLQALLDSRQQLLYTQAGAKLIAASDEITQSVIDIRA
jgi:hypothetical protein